MVVSKYHESGGHESVINHVCRHLSLLGHEIVIGSFSFEASPPEGITCLRLNRSPLMMRREAQRFDIIHNHQTINNYYSLISGNQFIFHYHGTSSRLQEANLWASLLICRKKISKIIAVSRASLSQLEKIAGKRHSMIPSEIITNGVDSKFYNLTLPRPYKKGSPQLLFVGNLYTHKNILKLINEMPSVLKYYPDAHLQIVGTGREYGSLKSIARRYSLENRIEFLGYSNPEKLRLIYSSSDIYVSASTREAFVLPPIEAMACGKPVLLSDIAPHKELVYLSGGGTTFSLHAQDDFVSGLKKINSNLPILADAARKYAESNDWSRVCKRISDVYDEICTDKERAMNGQIE
jgi:glycosyltransferase involved in cell wall biosynthesis